MSNVNMNLINLYRGLVSVLSCLEVCHIPLELFEIIQWKFYTKFIYESSKNSDHLEGENIVY